MFTFDGNQFYNKSLEGYDPLDINITDGEDHTQSNERKVNIYVKTNGPELKETYVVFCDESAKGLKELLIRKLKDNTTIDDLSEISAWHYYFMENWSVLRESITIMMRTILYKKYKLPLERLRWHLLIKCRILIKINERVESLKSGMDEDMVEEVRRWICYLEEGED